ncbi:hypothetical protein [Klebsiella sp. BIGb0407]|uniref:hypothetical protein n=1 Tax=Klebsiella sp. BIGb0407 TaxID=2940603 RepID=UPI0021685811|nr:hypothetical protein [Klebsiella sp. BIGb0407]MCS3432252.1 hypothetical protein [Klebsiella sp. BIGb0407]
MKLNESRPDNIGGVSGDIIKGDLNEPPGISRVITGVGNNTETKVDRVVHFFDTETVDISTKKSLAKRIFIGGTILTGVSALVAGGVYYFLGRQSTSNCLENMPPPCLPKVPAPVDRVLWNIGEGSSTTAGYTLRPEVDSTATPETSFSPYSYYEKIYGDRATQSQIRHQTSVSTTDKPDIITTSSSTSAYMKTKQTSAPDISETHDKMRSILYNALMRDDDNAQPLGPKFHAQISDFCYSELIKPAIEQAYTGDVNQRCTLLRNLSDIIDDFIVDEVLLIDEHDLLKALTKSEYMEELIIKRKVTTLIMAAESIMENKNFDEFYVDTMKNYKQYSTSEIEDKEIAIWKYLSDNGCLDDYYDSDEYNNKDSNEYDEG